MAVEVNEYVVSNDILTDAGELRARMDQEGYVFFRGLIDPAPIWDVRNDLVEVLQRFGWLKEGAPIKADACDRLAHYLRTWSVMDVDLCACALESVHYR